MTEDASEGPAVVVGNVAQHHGGPHKEQQVSKGQVQHINAETVCSPRLHTAASARQVTVTPAAKGPDHQTVQRDPHLRDTTTAAIADIYWERLRK